MVDLTPTHCPVYWWLQKDRQPLSIRSTMVSHIPFIKHAVDMIHYTPNK